MYEIIFYEDEKVYVYYKDRKFIVLHHFIKKTRKTPKRELEIAKKRLKEFKERND